MVREIKRKSVNSLLSYSSDRRNSNPSWQGWARSGSATRTLPPAGKCRDNA